MIELPFARAEYEQRLKKVRTEMQKRGLDYDSLKPLNPRLIMASLSAFGRKSPLAHKTGYDMIAQAFSGMMHMTGDPDGSPTSSESVSPTSEPEYILLLH